MSTNHAPNEWSMYKLGRKPRSKTGCRTCRIRKVKCDEEKLPASDRGEPQCRRCAVARIRCEWQGGPIPRRRGPLSASASKKKSQGAGQLGDHPHPAHSSAAPSASRHAQTSSPLVPLRPARDLSQGMLQAANSLPLTEFDRRCLDYLQDSALVVLLGKHWPWSTISYAYHRVAVREPMVMSMILASTASEIHRSRYHDGGPNSAPNSATRGCLAGHDLSDVDGQQHYGRALSGLREALKPDVKSPARIEAIFITLWLMVDYENRFGNGASAINIHFHGLQTLLHNHVVPLLEQQRHAALPDGGNSSALHGRAPEPPAKTVAKLSQDPSASGNTLRSTSVPLFLLWTLYFFTPGAAFYGANAPAPLDADLFRFFLRPEPESTSLSLADLYRISRQSPSRFWGEDYPATAQLDDMENLPGLTLYHRSHVAQFQITELFKHGPEPAAKTHEVPRSGDPHQRIVSELITIADEYDTLLKSAQSAAGVEIVSNDRRVMETIFWAAITYYSTIVYFHLCFPKYDHGQPLLSHAAAVSQVLELALKLHRSRPRLILRIVWQLFIAGIATADKIYQDWVSIRLRELCRYGQNYCRVSRRFDEIIQAGGEVDAVPYIRFGLPVRD